MDVELCYPLFSAELESAEALASSQQKFQTLYSNRPRHSNVRIRTEDWKVGPLVPWGVGSIPFGCFCKFAFFRSSLHHIKKMSLTPFIQGKITM